MSQDVTVSTIIERVRQLCDLPAFTTDTTVTTAAILDFVATSATLLGAIVKEYSDENLLTLSANIATQADVSVASLPAGCSDVLRVSWLKSSTEEVILQQATSMEFVAAPGGNRRWDGFTFPRYRLMGNTIEFYPTPPAVYTVRIYYNTGIYVTATTDVIHCRDGWDQWVVYNTCILCRNRQQKDASDFAGMLGKTEQSIRTQLKRDRFGSKRIRDVKGVVWDQYARRYDPRRW